MELKNQFSVLQSTTAIAAVALAGVGCSQQASETVDKGRPNVIVVLLDDLGSTDVGFSGCRDYHTPNIDRIANEGMSFSDAYISAPYSGPSRCGLMTGRYQQRFGAEGNIEGGTEAYDLQQGVLLSESLLSDVMKEQGYNTAAIGKWHLGDHPDLWPNQRGFDYFYGFAGGSYSFWGEKKDDKSGFIQEDGRPLENHETTYLTDDFTDKTLDFIDKSVKTDDPFFIYLAYNAPHTPLQAPQKYLDRTKHIYNAERSVYAAMMLAVDDGIGRIWESLEKHNIDDNTMIIFLSDNGGVAQRQALNTPRRAFKGNMFDGGIHTPFAIYWKGKIQAGSTYNKTISALDIFPTVATAAGFDVSKNKNPLDGVDLMPFITGKNNAAPHDRLFWRVCGGMEYAVRQGDYKLVKTFYSDDFMLFNITKDPIEMNDIAADNKELVAQMSAEYDKWNSEMMTPRWEDLHAPHQVLDYKQWSNYRKKASGGR